MAVHLRQEFQGQQWVHLSGEVKMVSPIDYTSAFTNPVEKFAEGYKLVTGIQQMQDQRALQAQQRERLNSMLERVQSPNATAQDYIGLSTVLPPEQVKAVNDTISAMDKRKQEAMLSESMQILSALRSGKPEIARILIEQRAAAERNSGNEPGAKFLDTMASVSELDGQALIPFYASMVSAIPGGKDALTALTSYEKAPGEARKTEAEARLKEQEADWYSDKTQAEINKMKATIAQTKKELEKNNFKVQSSQILDDGTVVYAGSGGERQVRDSSGNIVEGEEAAEAIRQAQEFGAEVQGMRSGERKHAEFTEKQIDRAFDGLEKIDMNITNLNDAISRIDEGAITGWVANNLPSVRASTIALKNAQGRLGLDVVNSATFGPLSEKEFKKALDIALPMDMKPAELKKWLQEKVAAQEKLRSYLYDQAQFLSSGGSRAEWAAEAKNRYKPKQQSGTPSPAGGDGAKFKLRAVRPAGAQ